LGKEQDSSEYIVFVKKDGACWNYYSTCRYYFKEKTYM